MMSAALKWKTVCELMIWLMMTSSLTPALAIALMSANAQRLALLDAHISLRRLRAQPRLLLLVHLMSDQAAGNHTRRRANQGARAAISRPANRRAGNRANRAAHQSAGAGVVRRAFRCVAACHQHRGCRHRQSQRMPFHNSSLNITDTDTMPVYSKKSTAAGRAAHRFVVASSLWLERIGARR